MAKKIVDVKTLRLAHTRAGEIRVKHIERPYGEHSNPVMYVGVSYDGEKIDSEVEIPYENLKDVLAALQNSQDVCNTFTHEHFHDELATSEDGGH